MVSYASCGKYDFSATGNCQNTERFAIAPHHPLRQYLWYKICI